MIREKAAAKLHERVGSRLKLRDLRLLLSVSERGSMAKAAADLNLTPSGVSRAISDLESVLGVRLFDRTAKGVEPTQYGRALLRGGTSVFADLRQSIEEIEQLADPGSGMLRVGCAEPMTWAILPAIIERLARRFPRMTCQIIQSSPHALRYRELPERRIDLAIGAIWGPCPGEDVDIETLCREKRFVVAGRQSKWVSRRKVTLSDLVDEAWALPPHETEMRSILEDTFSAQGLPAPRVCIVNHSIALNCNLVASGRFLTVLPGSMLRLNKIPMPLKILPIELPDGGGPVAILTVKNRSVSPLVGHFSEEAKQVVKPLVG